MTGKVDFKLTLKQLYNPSEHGFHIVEVPAMNFLMVDGIGNPNTSLDYQQSVEALYSMSYGIKFALKSQGFDHVVPPLEGLWWIDNMNEFTMENIERWNWTMMVMQPEWVTIDWIEKVRLAGMKKKNNDKLVQVRFERYFEGMAIQTLFIGAYRDEAPTISEMHKYISSNGYRTNGKHHEIYLGDPHKISADKLKTILRQPIRKA